MEYRESVPQESSNTGNNLIAPAKRDAMENVMGNQSGLRGAESPASTVSSDLTMRNRMRELMSTHPCHARRVRDLKLQAQELLSEYERAITRFKMMNKKVPESDRSIDGKVRNKKKSSTNDEISEEEDENRFDFVFEDPDTYDYDEFSLQSAQLAEECSALMVGKRKESVMAFLKGIRRSDKGWGN